MCGAISHLLWRGARLKKHRDNFTFTFGVGFLYHPAYRGAQWGPGLLSPYNPGKEATGTDLMLRGWKNLDAVAKRRIRASSENRTHLVQTKSQLLCRVSNPVSYNN
jgi:hypothetical protein